MVNHPNRSAESHAFSTMRKAILAWFREHGPDTPNVRVAFNRYIDADGVFGDISYEYCEGQCSRHPMKEDLEKAVAAAEQSVDFGEPISWQMSQRNFHVRIIHTHCEECKSKSRTAATQASFNARMHALQVRFDRDAAMIRAVFVPKSQRAKHEPSTLTRCPRYRRAPCAAQGDVAPLKTL